MRLWLALPALLVLPSCAGYGRHQHAHHASGHGGGGGEALVAVFQLIGAVVELAARSSREPVVVEEVPIPEPERVPPPRSPQRYRAPSSGTDARPSTPPAPRASPPPRLDAPAARAALSSRDVASCATRGVPHGYGHATVVFAPDGTVASVTVDSPAGITSDGVACLGEKLGDARVPAFAAGAVSVGTTWYVP